MIASVLIFIIMLVVRFRGMIGIGPDNMSLTSSPFFASLVAWPWSSFNKHIGDHHKDENHWKQPFSSSSSVLTFPAWILFIPVRLAI